MTLDKKIEQLRDEEARFKRCAAMACANDFESESERVNTVVANEMGQLADWLEELKRYKELEKQGRLVVSPCKIGDTVYEIIEETEPYHSYICEYEVQDVSMKAVMYADDWASYDYENLYFTREEAEAALEDVKRRNEIH